MIEIIEVEFPIAAILVRLLGMALTFIVGQWFANNSRIWLKTILKKQDLPESISIVFDIVEQGKLRLEEVGITIPFPQRDVHFYQSEAAAFKPQTGGRSS
ncbi:MAG: hypothetical protein GY796_21645 [Chloroflexi bacterium]|nr:hypothetical protein [Chloroflexota bacterium]